VPPVGVSPGTPEGARPPLQVKAEPPTAVAGASLDPEPLATRPAGPTGRRREACPPGRGPSEVSISSSALRRTTGRLRGRPGRALGAHGARVLERKTRLTAPLALHHGRAPLQWVTTRPRSMLDTHQALHTTGSENAPDSPQCGHIQKHEGAEPRKRAKSSTGTPRRRAASTESHSRSGNRQAEHLRRARAESATATVGFTPIRHEVRRCWRTSMALPASAEAPRSRLAAGDPGGAWP
jgi:hypothetical protein